MTTAVLADAPGVVRELVADALVAGGVDVVATCASVPDLITAAQETRAEVAVVGDAVRTPDLAAAVATLLARGTRTVVVSSAPLDEPGSRVLLAGASGFLLLDDTTATDLAASVEAVASGRTALHPDVARAVLEQWRAHRAPAPEPAPAPGSRPELSTRELEVLRGLAAGQTVRDLAKTLGVAEKTVEAHRARLYAKLGARNHSHAVTLGRELGWLPA